MVEFTQKKDYSMPRQCGIFPPPPIDYYKARAAIILFQCPSNIKEKCLPPELKPIEGGLDSILILEYPETTIGPYNEMVLFLNCIYKNKPGLYVFNIYVDDDIALTAGREVWGFPKKMCEITLTPIQEKKIRGTLNRKGIIFLDVEIELMDTPPGLDIKQTFESLPIYNLKLIPDVSDNSKPVLRQLTETNINYGDFHTTLGAQINYVKSQNSQYDICHELLKEVKDYLGAVYIECDFILPNGHVLE